VPALDRHTPRDAHIRMSNPRGPGDEARRFLRRPFVYANGFDAYGLLDSGSVFLAFCRDLERQFQAVKERTVGQDLDEYMVAVGGGYFLLPARCEPGGRLPGQRARGGSAVGGPGQGRPEGSRPHQTCGQDARRGYRYPIGLTGDPPMRTSKWRCGPVELPVLPT
jgi:hypothetical protein